MNQDSPYYDKKSLRVFALKLCAYLVFAYMAYHVLWFFKTDRLFRSTVIAVCGVIGCVLFDHHYRAFPAKNKLDDNFGLLLAALTAIYSIVLMTFNIIYLSTLPLSEGMSPAQTFSFWISESVLYLLCTIGSACIVQLALQAPYPPPEYIEPINMTKPSQNKDDGVELGVEDDD